MFFDLQSCILNGLQFLDVGISYDMVFEYSKTRRVIALNVETINSFCLPHLVEVSALRMLSVCFGLVMVTFICCENVCFGSTVIPRIFECFFVGNVWLFNFSDKVVPCSAESGVRSVVVVLSVFI